MCGIFLANNKEEFLKQYIANLERGASEFSGLFIKNKKLTFLKTNDTEHFMSCNADYYLGHLRAPTGNTRDFSIVHSHPFEYENWLVAHNGILTNFEDLKSEIPESRFSVDSSIIPYYIDKYGFKSFEKFKGTWACWIYNKHTDELFITRSDNTLFYDPANGNFSSAHIGNYIPLDERKIFKIRNGTNIYEEQFNYKTKPLYFVA